LNPFIRKLRHGASLTSVDEQILAELAHSVHQAEARRDLSFEGEAPRTLVLILEGWACRYKQLENGRRQIISVFIPGDLCEPFGVLPQFMESSIATLTPAVVARVPLDEIRKATQVSLRIEEALWWDLLTATALDRERVVSLGRRSASERLGHFFCELYFRLGAAGLVEQREYEMPITQADLADLLGLSVVHLNRSLQELRGAGLISLRGRRLRILNLERLKSACFFDEAYLHHDARP
jgi:CRP-like cAMP-binding protein